MRNLNSYLGLLGPLSGLNFKVIGPFFVADFTNDSKVFEQIKIGPHGMEPVCKDEKTKGHTHEFVSFYKSIDLDVEWNGVKFTLPQQALTLVLPGIDHSWVPKKSKGFVGSADSRHEKQQIENVITV